MLYSSGTEVLFYEEITNDPFDCILALQHTCLECQRGPAAPSVKSSVKDCTYSVYTSHTVTLTARFAAPAQGSLKYQWYVSETNDKAALTEIPGANGETYCPPVSVGTKYYCVAAWVVDGSEVSDKIYDRLARVEFTETTVKVESMTLDKAPYKTTYYQGETLNLTGMHVTVSSGFDIIDSLDGSGIIITTAPLNKLGEQQISFTYGNGSVTGYFTVNVIKREEVHNHVFGDWITISEPNCGIDGIKVRRCSCGEDVTETIPASGQHNWEIVRDSEGTRYYKCPDCLSERLPGSSSSADTTPNQDGQSGPQAPKKDSAKFPWWIILILVILLLIGGAVLYLYLLEQRRKKKKAARKRPQLPE